MQTPPKALLKLALLAGVVLATGCAPARPLTPEGQARQVHKDMRAIHTQAEKYMEEHGSLPAGSHRHAREVLVENAFIWDFPQPPTGIFTAKPMVYHLVSEYAQMGGGPDRDAAIAVWGLTDAVCREYNRLFASDDSGPTIFDYQAHGNRYPGEALGTHMQTYAIKWRSDDIDDCEIEWVIQYR